MIFRARTIPVQISVPVISLKNAVFVLCILSRIGQGRHQLQTSCLLACRISRGPEPR
uniref:Uncharacterized protein n=1 Tax=Arundo donax TaxID=35708 RepID=A0A0A9FJZ3_ARUDO